MVARVRLLGLVPLRVGVRHGSDCNAGICEHCFRCTCPKHLPGCGQGPGVPWTCDDGCPVADKMHAEARARYDAMTPEQREADAEATEQLLRDLAEST